MMQRKVTIVRNDQLSESFYRLTVLSEDIAEKIQAGQFVFVRISDGVMPLLRRPFSVAWVSEKEINLIYKIVGRGTDLLKNKAAGESLDIMGPLGKGFTMVQDKKIILIAGGIGVASLISLMRQYDKKDITLFYGCRTKCEFIAEHFIPHDEVIYTTDDGSLGREGIITPAFEEFIVKHKINKDNAMVYVCGPLPMIKSVVTVANKYNLCGEASLEERMACGVGACLGCAVKTNDSVKIVCKEGPVFPFDQLRW